MRRTSWLLVALVVAACSTGENPADTAFRPPSEAAGRVSEKVKDGLDSRARTIKPGTANGLVRPDDDCVGRARTDVPK